MRQRLTHAAGDIIRGDVATARQVWRDGVTNFKHQQFVKTHSLHSTQRSPSSLDPGQVDQSSSVKGLVNLL